MGVWKPGPIATGIASLKATLAHRQPVPEPPPTRGPVVWVLSGGGAMGAAQAGMAQALLGAGIVPEVLVGCSAGALNAAGIAKDPTPAGVAALAHVWTDMARSHPLDVKPMHALGQLIRRRDHVIDPTPMRSTLQRIIGEADLSEFVLPVHVVTTRLSDGRMTWHTHGPAVQILAASAALPGLLPPVALDDGLHVDGGVTDLIPIDRALDLAPSRVWVFDVAGSAAGRAGHSHNALDVLAAGFAISLRQQAPATAAYAGDSRVVRITLDQEIAHLKVGLRDFTHAKELIAAGRAAAGRMLLADSLATI